MKKIIALITLTALIAIALPALAEQDHGIYTDSLGNEFTLARMPERTVCLLGSFAESWLLAGGALVGTTDDAISERALELPESTQVIGTVKEPNLELILALEPDFVVLSADTASHTAIGDSLRQMGIPCAFYSVATYSDYMAMMRTFCEITDRDDLYQAQVEAVEQPIQAAIARAQAQPEYGTHTCLLIRAFSSGAKVKNSDNLAGAVLHDMGLVNIADTEESLLEALTLESIIAYDPDYIFVTIMGGDDEKALAALEQTITGNPAWAGLSAVQSGNYHVLDKALFHYKPNARWAESFLQIEDIIYGE